MDKPKASIVVRTYNEERYLPELLKGIEGQDTSDLGAVETVLVDSGSTDRTVRVAEAAGARIVRIEKEEFSFGRSLNLGCEAARGEILVFVSGHCIPERDDWLSRLLEPFSSDEVAITYGRQIGGGDTKFSEHRIFAKYFPDSEEPSQGEIFCNNANAALRRDAWKAQPFDEKLTGLEDMAMAKALVASGWKVAYAHRAPVFHLHHESWRQVKRRYEREAIALQQIMPEVQLGLSDSLRYFGAALMGDTGAAIEERRLIRTLPSIFAFRFCQFYGAWRGHHHHRKLSRREKERYFYPN